MGNIAPWMFEDLFKLAGAADDWQIVIRKDGLKDLIEFHVESANGHDPAGLRDAVLATFRQQWADQWRQIEMGLLRIDVKPHAKGELRTGRKLQRIVDTRRF